jgi:phosphopantothenoylcysteine decarboxylase/phosphopantothenate--cysteine ligase
MGYAVAEAAASRGADVVLVSGPTALPCPRNVKLIPVRSALEMEGAILSEAENSDAVVMAAAVSDFRPAETSSNKLKKQESETTRRVELVQNPDILKGLGERFKSTPPMLVGFAVETENLLENAKVKLVQKGAQIIVANLASKGFGGEDNEAIIVDNRGNIHETGPMSKRVLADQLLDFVMARLNG